MTGAPLPQGADAVVPLEDTTEHVVTIERGRPIGAFVHECGSDITAGMLLVAADTHLEPRHIAALSAAGLPSVHTYPKPRVADHDGRRA